MLQRAQTDPVCIAGLQDDLLSCRRGLKQIRACIAGLQDIWFMFSRLVIVGGVEIARSVSGEEGRQTYNSLVSSLQKILD